ncbi:uncharacterized protein ACLA_018830 [Aspergillus clavatus NRRL 1]|uniref:Beta-galactosidase domain-containing protein n=1 Tax=Aspergillus clavatus (strain ATCC 1007 / CBS 513.65 / DSM 816 / NCTC 3887 / NRRL 1 / QM 1276 / 107) TaxID=344612 RepID=A1CNF8_ASPCL|nr:uncharacterized protein ACLA_018830 [Aspergillus clavatus NRRL 1]EAW07179.1 hypothetical protein ACLA_018830 [Aspergillus clavatus NRRL 1]
MRGLGLPRRCYIHENKAGNADVAGLESYPSCWTCDVSQCISTNGEYIPYKVIDYYDYFQEVHPTPPSFMPGFQGGCPEDTGADFANLFYRWNIAQRVTAMSLYMLYWGINWGAIAAPVTAMSYGYSAPISEDRSIVSKYYETRLLALFIRSAKDLTMTEMIGNDTQYTANGAIRAFELRSPQTSAGFYVTFYRDTTVGTNETFKLHVGLSVGALTVPQREGTIQLNGHQAKIIVTGFTFGAETLLYSMAEVLTYNILDKDATLVLWVPRASPASLPSREPSPQKSRTATAVRESSSTARRALVVNFTQANGLSVVQLNNGVRVVLLNKTAAYHFWTGGLGLYAPSSLPPITHPPTQEITPPDTAAGPSGATATSSARQPNPKPTKPLSFLPHALPATQNVLLVLHVGTGHDQTSGVLNPLGMLAARLLPAANANVTRNSPTGASPAPQAGNRTSTQSTASGTRTACTPNE